MNPTGDSPSVQAKRRRILPWYLAMDKEYIEENAVIDRYVMARLSEQELEQFEVYMLDNPAVLADIEYAAALHSALQPTPEPGSSADEEVKSESNRHVLHQRPFLAAAMVLLAVASALCVTLYLENRSMHEQLAKDRGLQAVSGQLVLVSTRSDSVVPEVWIDANPSPMIITFEVPAEFGGSAVIISISGVDSDFFWQSEDAVVNSRYEVQVVMRSLPKGVYEISAAPMSGQGTEVGSIFGVR